MPPKRITLKDVAREAGVATGTVSMVLNDSPLVADTTRARVQQVMRELGYVYHRAAANLRNKRSSIVGVAICDLASAVVGTSGRLGARRALVLGNSAESVPRQMHFLETLREYNVDGLLLTPAVGTPKAHLTRVLEWGLPIVQVSRYVAGVDTDYVGNDNRLATELATRHLLSLGHQRIAYIGLNRLTSTGRDRYAGFRAALKGVEKRSVEKYAGDARVVECAATRADGFRAIMSLFSAGDPPTAVVCFSDVLAFGAMLGLRHMGLEPGQECSVVGLDDVDEAALWQPALTTVAIDRDKIGQVAGRLLTDRIAEPDRPTERVVLAPRLVARESSGKPPAAKAVVVPVATARTKA